MLARQEGYIIYMYMMSFVQYIHTCIMFAALVMVKECIMVNLNELCVLGCKK